MFKMLSILTCKIALNKALLTESLAVLALRKAQRYMH